MVKHVSWDQVPLEQMNPRLDRQFINGDQLTLARIVLRKGVVVPEHQHPNEQFAYIVEGALKFTLEGRDVVVRAGEVLCIPANVPHKAEALEDTLDLDVFSPPRADWANKDDAYLRSK